MGIRLILLACSIAHNVLPYELCKTGPPELSSNKLLGFKVSRVTSCLMVMTSGEDSVAEGTIRQDVDMTFVCEDVIIKFPVRKL